MAQAAQRAYEHLRARLLAGEFPAGSRLPEEELAAAAEVSRTPVREALRRLHAEGLVEFVPNRGAHVASWTERDLDEIFGLRALLESHAAELAAPRISGADLGRLSALQDQMDAAGRRGGTGGLDRVAEQPHLAAERGPGCLDETTLEQGAGTVAIGIAAQIHGALLSIRPVVDLDRHVLAVHPLRERLERPQAVAEQEERPDVVGPGPPVQRDWHQGSCAREDSNLRPTA